MSVYRRFANQVSLEMAKVQMKLISLVIETTNQLTIKYMPAFADYGDIYITKVWSVKDIMQSSGLRTWRIWMRLHMRFGQLTVR